MMVNQPGSIIKPDHGQVAQDSALFLVDEMPGDIRFSAVKLSICFLDLFFVFLEKAVLPRVDKAGIEEKFPKD